MRSITNLRIRGCVTFNPLATNSNTKVSTVYTRIRNPPFHRKGIVNLVKSHRV